MGIFTLILFFLSGVLPAQNPYFQTHPLAEAYRNARLELIFEDRNSLLWLGSSEGLFAYNGLDHIPYLTEENGDSHVRSIYQDAEGVLWVGYHSGAVYSLENGKLQKWEPEEGTPAVPITGFCEDGQGRLWIATYGEGLYFLDKGRIYNINRDDGLLGDEIYVIKKGPDGNIWAGTDGGISICSYKDNEKLLEELTREDGLPDEIVRTLLLDEKGNFWVGTYGAGVCYFDTRKQLFSYPFPDWEYGVVSELELFRELELWIGTEGDGVRVYSLRDSSLKPMSLDNSLENAKIYDLHRDVEGNIWVISNTHGLCHSNRQFSFLETPFSNIQAVLSDEAGRFWAGNGEGLFLWSDPSSGIPEFQAQLKEYELNVISLYEDKFGNIWVGTFGEGIYIFHPDKEDIRHLNENDGIANGSVLSMAGVNGKLWLATLGGVTELEIEADPLLMKSILTHNFDQEDGLGTNFIYKVFIDSRERPWFATDGKGISVLENNQIQNYQYASLNKDSFDHVHSLNRVYSITEDRNGNIWFSTAKDGIFKFDGNGFQQLTVKEGIRDLAITSLVTDPKGNILIVHPNGVDILDPETCHLIYYDEEVGIRNIDPNLNVVCKDGKGDIWMGCRNGIVQYITLKEKLEIHPRTILNAVSVFLEPFDFRNRNRFSYDQNNLVFDYMGLWYTDPETVKYRYQLDGYDLDWITTRDRRVTYSNLPAGSYIFKISATENDAWLDEPVIYYAFTVQMPVWKQGWFLFLIGIFLAAVFLYYQKERDKRLQRVSLLEKEKAESQLAALKAQINPHFLFNSFNTLAAIIEENRSGAVEYVEKLSDFYRSMLQFRDKELIPLEEELEMVKNYSYLLQKRFGNNFSLQIELKEKQVFIVPLTLQILLENAVKHNVISKSKPLNVLVCMDGPDYIMVKNNLQKKIKPEDSTHFGLQSLVKRYELISKKRIRIEENGEYFRVSIPLLK